MPKSSREKYARADSIACVSVVLPVCRAPVSSNKQAQKGGLQIAGKPAWFNSVHVMY